MPLTVPAAPIVKCTPSSTALGSLARMANGWSAGVNKPTAAAGVTVTVTPAAGDSMLRLSSTARDLMVNVPESNGHQVYVQLVVPVAGCHVVPPSVETSTTATSPPLSLAEPEIVTGCCCTRLAPAVGVEMIETGAVWSVEALAAT